MDVSYVDKNTYMITFDEKKHLTIIENNIIKCKQVFLDLMSKKFDDEVNKKLGNYGFFKDE